MLKKRNHLPSYPDGVVRFYLEKDDNHTTFGAKENAVKLSDLDFVNCVVYSIESIRDRDIQFAEQQGKTLTLKIRCPFCPGLTTECKALIGDLLYDVAYYDPNHQEVFVYLEGGRILIDDTNDARTD